PCRGRSRGQRDSAGGLAEALARFAGSSDSAGFAGNGVSRNRRRIGHSRGHGEVAHQPWASRARPSATQAEVGDMNCAELEALICDYVDGTLAPAQRTELESHLAECPACAELARDSAAAIAFIDRAADVEPPPELITRI